MIRNVKRTWFEVWGDEYAQNQILKGLLLFMGILLGLETVGLVVLSLRKPLVVAVSDALTKSIDSFPSEEVLEEELRRVATTYFKNRHEWEWNTIEARLKNAQQYIHPGFLRAFSQGVSSQVKAVKEKHISQKFFFDKPIVDKSTKKVRVSGERILLVDGLRAASPINVEVEYELGSRTPQNLEGIYFTSESPIPSQGP